MSSEDFDLDLWNEVENIELGYACVVRHKNVGAFLENFTPLVPNIMNLVRTPRFRKIFITLSYFKPSETMSALLSLPYLLQAYKSGSTIYEELILHPDLFFILMDSDVPPWSIIYERVKEVKMGLAPPHIICFHKDRQNKYFVAHSDGYINLTKSSRKSCSEAFQILFKLFIVKGIPFPPILEDFYHFVSHYLFDLKVYNQPPSFAIRLYQDIAHVNSYLDQ